ncbi:MAG TPA: enoyl-CoA hydratase/isomerase family protein [Rhodocyclaceae bacterium]
MAFEPGAELVGGREHGGDGLQNVPGLNYRTDGKTLRATITDPPNRNALTRAALDSLYETIDRFDRLPFDRLSIEFDTGTTSVACAGLNLRDFETAVRQMAPGEDMLGPAHYLVRATAALRTLSRRTRTEAIVGGHLVGAGVELALSCRHVACVRPDAKILLPHLRIGVPYHTAGLVHMAGIIGWDVLSRAMVTDALPVLLSEVLADRPKIRCLDSDSRIRQAKTALDRMAAVFHGRPVKIGSGFFIVEDRTGKTRHIAEAHMIQIMSHVLFGANIADLPSALQEIIDAPRIRASSCDEDRVTGSIAAHRAMPKQLNRHFSNAIGADLAPDAT